MRKTLLIAAATLAAGIISSGATGVYSQNIVGYVNLPIRSGYNLIAMPLNSPTGTNGLGEVLGITNGSSFDGNCSFLTWNGAGYSYTAFDSGYGGWIDANYAPTTEPLVNPGSAFFFNNAGPSNTVTVAGNVAVNVGVVTTNALSPGYSLVGSQIPFGGPIDSTNLNIPIIANDGSFSILQWNPLTGKYIYSAYDSGYGGWIDANYNNISTPNLGIGEGFFYNNGNSLTQQWTQVLSP